MLSERVSALADVSEGTAAAGSELKAITLFDGEAEWETVLLDKVQELAGLPAGKEVSWQEAGALAVRPELERAVANYRRGLAGLTPEALPALAQNQRALRKRFYPVLKKVRERKDMPAAAEEIIGAALAVLLLDRGWSLEYAPGIELAVRHGADATAPHLPASAGDEDLDDSLYCSGGSGDPPSLSNSGMHGAPLEASIRARLDPGFVKSSPVAT